MEMQSPDHNLTADLPPRLAALLQQHQGWKANDEPIAMTRIPGVVDISMNKLKKLVADGVIPHELRDRTKLIKPSDVRAYLQHNP